MVLNAAMIFPFPAVGKVFLRKWGEKEVCCARIGDRIGICPGIVYMSIEKLTDKLVQHIEKTGEDMLEIIVELDPSRGDEIVSQSGDMSRQDRITKLREDFAEQSAAVASAIEKAGGEILDQAWINKTLKVRVPVKNIESITGEKEVTSVDLPETVQLEKE
jgi:hypothetical protein